MESLSSVVCVVPIKWLCLPYKRWAAAMPRPQGGNVQFGRALDENQGYTPVTRRITRATRSTSSPLNLRATKKANQRAVSRITESERKNSVEVTRGGDQLAFRRDLVEILH
jgi:hypothetical protein